MSPRTLPAAVLMPEYEALLREGAELPLVVSGESMLPFLRPGRDTVLHRVFRAEPGMYWFLGDAQTRVEGPLPAQCVFAHVTAVRRGKRLIQPENLLWRFFAGPWLKLLRRRPRLLRVYRWVYYHSSKNIGE